MKAIADIRLDVIKIGKVVCKRIKQDDLPKAIADIKLMWFKLAKLFVKG